MNRKAIALLLGIVSTVFVFMFVTNAALQMRGANATWGGGRVKGGAARLMSNTLPPGSTLRFHLRAPLPQTAVGDALKITKMAELVRYMKQRHDDVEFRLMSKLFSVEERHGELTIPDAFEGRAREMFAAYPHLKEAAKSDKHALDFLTKQTVVVSRNKYTQETSMFNEVRRYRPGYFEKLAPHAQEEFQARINKTSGDACDFCKMRVAFDIFGKIEGKHCFVASNVAKYDRWHGLVISKRHHPLAFSTEEVYDYLDASMRWFKEAHQRDPQAQYPHIMWDATPRAGASQMHLHAQISLSAGSYYTHAEQIRKFSEQYSARNDGANFWVDVARVHDRLGLAVHRGRSVLFSHLCPTKERELIILSPEGTDASFAELISAALEVMRDDIGTAAFSLAIMFEPLHSDRDEKEWVYPAIARVVDRGSTIDPRSDVGAMEFFGGTNVGADPYQIAPFLRKKVAALPPLK